MGQSDGKLNALYQSQNILLAYKRTVVIQTNGRSEHLNDMLEITVKDNEIESRGTYDNGGKSRNKDEIETGTEISQGQ